MASPMYQTNEAPSLDVDELREYLDQVDAETDRMRAQLEEMKLMEKLFNQKMALAQKIISELLREKTELVGRLTDSKDANRFFLHKFAETCRQDPNIKLRMQSIDPFWQENERLFEPKTSKKMPGTEENPVI